MARRSPCVLALQQSADGEAQTLTEVDLFISTQRIKVLNADSQVSVKQHTDGPRVSLHCVVFSSPFISTSFAQSPRVLRHPAVVQRRAQQAVVCWFV